VSTGLVARLPEDELLAVLRHEAHHRAYRDPLKILASRALASAVCFLPVAGALHHGFLEAKEMAADADASRHDGPAALARALVRLMGSRQREWPSGVLAVGALTSTEARLRHLVDPAAAPRTLPRPLDWIVTAAVVAGILGFCTGAQAVGRTVPASTLCLGLGAAAGTTAQLALDHPVAPPAAAGEVWSAAERRGPALQLDRSPSTMQSLTVLKR
jgi:beta-lactamase regulating signal transducer with metallopeptidase domain